MVTGLTLKTTIETTAKDRLFCFLLLELKSFIVNAIIPTELPTAVERSKMQKVPQCIGVIVDGNRRWAKKNGLSPLEGHEAGYRKLRELLHWARDAGVEFVIAYVFSSENWNRAAEEVSYLMELAKRVFWQDLPELKQEKVRIRVIGNSAPVSQKLQILINNAEKETASFTDLTLVLAFSYGGREEILQAVNRIIGEKRAAVSVTKNEFERYLWTAGIPDPDLIIRTSGEQRLSGFLPWQAAYSELFFLPMLFPDLTRQDFSDVLEEYSKRERRFGS